MVVVGLVVNQAHSAVTSVTSQPLQNTGTDGALVYSGDYVFASTVVTRHEKSALTLNGSDQITSVTVDGTKVTGDANIQLDLLDSLSAVLDTATGSLTTATGGYSTGVTLTGGTTKYSSVATVTTTYTAWWNTSWQNRRKITFDNSAQTTDDLLNFPVLVSLTDPANIDYTKTQDQGQDIRFIDDDDTTELNYEIEAWDETGTSLVWVKVPNIPSGSNTDFIYMYYNNTGATAQHPSPYTPNAFSQGTWNTNYKGVWHLKEDPTANACGGSDDMCDSTSNGNDAAAQTMAAGDQVAGEIDGSLDFDGSSDYLEDADGEDYINGVTAFTVSLWVESDVTGTDKGFFNAKPAPGGDNTLSIRYDQAGSKGGGTDVIKAGITVSGQAERHLESSSLAQTTSWQHLTLTWSSGNQLALYINGSLDTPTFNHPAQSGSISGATTMIIGQGTKDGPGGWDGQIDEVRFSSESRSADWIAAQYKSMKLTYNTFADEE